MREIKFRVWNGKNMQQLTIMGLAWEHDSNPCLYVNKNGDDNAPLLYLEDTQPMQYTGLKDKNGVEIYEGDVVLYRPISKSESGKRKFVVEWQEKLRNVGFNVSRGYQGANQDKYEVIGNIYESPELLK